MEIKTSVEIIKSVEPNFDCTCDNCSAVTKRFEKSKKNKKWVNLENLKGKLRETKQFSCLESWCASRHKDKVEYCRNCKDLNKLLT